jgi:toxin ParE1/3/4
MSVPKFQLTFSILAQRDIDDIIAYTFENWGRAQLDVYKNALDQVLSVITKNPDKARKHRPGLYVMPVAKHRIFYRIANNTIIIVRILHQRMDEGSHVGL